MVGKRCGCLLRDAKRGDYIKKTAKQKSTNKIDHSRREEPNLLINRSANELRHATAEEMDCFQAVMTTTWTIMEQRKN